jgi:hypothetical protein
MAYSTIQDEGTALTQRSTLNFIGDSVAATDNGTRTDVTIAAVKLQTASPGTAQTGNFNIDTGIGRLALQDKGGQVFNVRAYGAVGDGMTDDTAAINSALSAAGAASPRGVLLFPHGVYKTTGLHNITGYHGLTIAGSGIGTTVVELAHATNNLFDWTTGEIRDLDVRDLSVTSTLVTRTGGWVLQTPTSGILRRSRIQNIDLKKQVNGFWLQQYQFVWFNGILITNSKAPSSGSNYGIRLGQSAAGNWGAEIYFNSCAIFGGDYLGSDPIALDYGVFAENCSAIYMENVSIGGVLQSDLKITAGSGAFSSDHFISNSAFDTTRNSHCVHLTGAGAIRDTNFVGCWFASAGQDADGVATANGMRIDATEIGRITVVGSRFLLCKATGLAIVSSGGAPLTIVGNTFTGNGTAGTANNNDSVYVDVGINNLAPALFANFCTGANGVSLRTSATTNLLSERCNRWESSTALGITPGQMVESQTALGGGQVTITTTARADLASVTYTPKNTSRYLICASFDVEAATVSGGSVLVGELLVNGAAEAAALVWEEKTNGVRACLSRTWAVVLNGGSAYTIKTTAKLNVAGATYKVNPTHTTIDLIGEGRF